MNILQCGLSMYYALFPPRKIYAANTSPIVIKIISPNMLLLMDADSSEFRVRLHGIITPNLDSSSSIERHAARVAMSYMRYQFVNKTVSFTNCDVVCDNCIIKRWMLNNKLAVREHTQVPDNWMEHMQGCREPTVPLRPLPH